jgi:hypothetical protein
MGRGAAELPVPIGERVGKLKCIGEAESVRFTGGDLVRHIKVRCDCGNEYNAQLRAWGRHVSCFTCYVGPETPTWIYGLFNDRDRLIYVGITIKNDPRKRYDSVWDREKYPHQTWRYEIAYQSLLHPVRVPFSDALLAERLLIEQYGNRLNNTHHYNDADTTAFIDVTTEHWKSVVEAALAMNRSFEKGKLYSPPKIR